MFVFQVVQYIDLRVKAETELEMLTVGGSMVTSGPVVV